MLKVEDAHPQKLANLSGNFTFMSFVKGFHPTYHILEACCYAITLNRNFKIINHFFYYCK